MPVSPSQAVAAAPTGPSGRRRTTFGRVAFNVAGVAVCLVWLAAFGLAIAVPLAISSICRAPAFSMWPDPQGAAIAGVGAVGACVLFAWSRRRADLRLSTAFLILSFGLGAAVFLRGALNVVGLFLAAIACS
jgi:hypothetical protein